MLINIKKTGTIMGVVGLALLLSGKSKEYVRNND